jgi:hypothetical protein
VTRCFYDTEFIEDGKTIDLISIGIVDDSGREYYAVAEDAPWKRIKKHDWLMANVVPHLPQLHGDDRNLRPRKWLIDMRDPAVKPRGQIAREVRNFFLGAESEVELWANYCAYDHVCLAQLFGTMMDLPKSVPMFTCDLQQELRRRGNPPIPAQESTEHNALADARYVRDVMAALEAA